MRRYPTSKRKRKLLADGRKGKITFRIKPRIKPEALRWLKQTFAAPGGTVRLTEAETEPCWSNLWSYGHVTAAGEKQSQQTLV